MVETSSIDCQKDSVNDTTYFIQKGYNERNIRRILRAEAHDQAVDNLWEKTSINPVSYISWVLLASYASLGTV